MDLVAKMVNDCCDLAVLRKQSPELELVFQKDFLVPKFTLASALASLVYKDLDNMRKWGVALLDDDKAIDKHILWFAVTVVYDGFWDDFDWQKPPETFADLDMFVDKCFFWHVDDDNEFRSLTIRHIDEYFEHENLVHSNSESE
ncbi:unnamed protein product [Symbiodinium microadriaticum]|nr:unnamed protein product [Symbiodinium microadriaticum]CAE7911267.1 unnamed protein product [Symbiodinium sp. KB8]